MSLCAGAPYCGDPAVRERLGPALLPFPRRGLLAPLPRGGSAPRCATRALAPGRGPPPATGRPLGPLRLSLGAPTKPSWLLDSVSSKGGTAPQHLATPGAQRVARGRSYSSLPTFRGGPAPARSVTTPFLPDHTRCSGPCWEPALSLSASLGGNYRTLVMPTELILAL